MNAITRAEFAGRIEDVLRDRGQADLIPEGGLYHWVAQGWTQEELQEGEFELGADLWIEQVRDHDRRAREIEEQAALELG